jgi:hypothetical protein
MWLEDSSSLNNQRPARPPLFVYHHLQEYTRSYSELTDHEDSARATIVVNNNMNIVAVIVRVPDKPSSGGNATITVTRWRLLTRRATWIPNPAFARRRIVALGNV